MFCPFCGKENPDGSKFCVGCGSALEAGGTASRSTGTTLLMPDEQQVQPTETTVLTPEQPEPAPAPAPAPEPAPTPEPQPQPAPQVPPAQTASVPPQQPPVYAGQTETKKGGKGPIIAIAIAAVAIIALLAVFVLPGLGGKSDEEIIREGISAEFDAIMDKNSEEYQEIVEEVDASAGMDEFGVTGEEFVGSLLDGFDYEITSIEVDDANDTAVCYVTVTSKTFADILPDLEQRITEFMSDPSVYNKSTDELYTMMGEVVMESVDSAEPRPVDLELLCNRDEDGNWSEDDSVEDEISRLLME